MTFKRFLYILLVVVVAGLSALGGAVAGGYGVYQAVRNSAGFTGAGSSGITGEQHQSSHNADSSTRPIFKPRSLSLFKKLGLRW